MTLALELTPAQEAHLRAAAALAGVEPAILLLSPAPGCTPVESIPQTANALDWQREAERLRLWADGHSPKSQDCRWTR